MPRTTAVLLLLALPLVVSAYLSSASRGESVYGILGRGVAQTDKEGINHPAHDDPRHVILRSHRVDTRLAEGFTDDQHARLAARSASHPHQFLVHFGRALEISERKAFVDAAGAPLGSYFPHHTYHIMLTPDQARRVHSHPLVQWVGLFHPEFKGASLISRVEHAGKLQETVSLFVLLPPVPRGEGGKPLVARTLEDAQAVANRWNTELSALGFPVSVSAASPAKLVVDIFPPMGVREDPRAEARNVAEWIAEQPESHHIELKPQFETLNSYSQGITQGGEPNKPTLWARGITGTGQIVGVGDSGIDHDSCFFHDPNVPTPISTGTSNAGGVNPNHRKMVNYHVMNGADNRDDVDGHGTHVAGSAAGATIDPQNPLASYGGMAKDSKIAFLDIGITGGGLSGIPNDLNANYFPLGYAAGARIHTNSWGVPCYRRGQGCAVDNSGLCAFNTYTTNAAESDEFMYDNKDFLILFAAGNDGSSGCNQANAGFHTTASPATAKNILSVGATLNAPEGHQEYCDYINGGPNCNAFYAERTDIFNHRSMADFSSRGPTRDIRIKPDISAPGFPIFSARSDGNTNTQNCGENPDDVLLSGGTSMATPIVAGNAALVRQYFADGWYPSGTAVPEDAMEPSAALVKAAIINSGQDMTGYVDIAGNNQFTQLDSTPSNFFGFGGVQLDKVLYFYDNTEEPNRKLLVKLDADKTDPAISQGQTQEDCYQVSDVSTPLKFTLVWTDPPANPTTGVALVNDLDLTVVKDGAETWVGNGVFSAKNGATPDTPDRRNNVEQVYIPTPTPGEYCVSITATNIGGPDGSQEYAFIASGGFAADELPPSEGNPILDDDDQDDDDDSSSGSGAASGSVAIYAGGAAAALAVVALIGFVVVRRRRSAGAGTPYIAASSSAAKYQPAATNPPAAAPTSAYSPVPAPSSYVPPTPARSYPSAPAPGPYNTGPSYPRY